MTLVKLETGGLVCPFPLIDAKKKMAELAVGDELLIALIVRKQRKVFQTGLQIMIIL